MLTGPSGAGKSLLFQIIAGIKRADHGTILLNGKDISKLPVQKRQIGLLFQHNTLFPHLNVRQNIEYPLKIRNIKSAERKRIINRLSEESGIAHLLERTSENLSGGELQRVSVCRALASGTKYLLLDEPLSSLDVQLRGDLRQLLRRLHKEGYTILHITHDQREAFQLAERMAVIDQGKIIQCAKPIEIFKAPASKFVADFVGYRNFYNINKYTADGLLLDNSFLMPLHKDVKVPEATYLIIPENAILIGDKARQKEGGILLEAYINDLTYYPEAVDISFQAGIKIRYLCHETHGFRDELQLSKKIALHIDTTKLLFV